MFYSAWRVNIFLEDRAYNMSLGNDSDSNATTAGSIAIPDEIWATRVYIYAIGGTAVAAIGLLCNCISIVVLAHFRQKSSAPFLLICLEVVDCVLLLSEMVLETLATLSQAGLIPDSYRDFIRPIYVVMYPVPHIAQTGTTMMTVLITVERYVAVARPLLAATVCSKPWARRAVLAILVYSLLFHVPLYLAYSYHDVLDPDTNATRVAFYRTALGESQFYNYWFVVWINLACEFLIPFLVIFVLNVLMIRALHKARRAMNKSSAASVVVAGAGGGGGGGGNGGGGGGGGSGSQAAATTMIIAASASVNKRAARESRLTGMVIAITAIFFVCELFPAVALIVVRGKDAFSECSVACAHFVSVADTMVLLNSGINFVAYCAIGKQFRDIFVKIFLRHRPGSGRRNFRDKAQRGTGSSGDKGGGAGNNDLSSTLMSSTSTRPAQSSPSKARLTLQRGGDGGGEEERDGGGDAYHHHRHDDDDNNGNDCRPDYFNNHHHNLYNNHNHHHHRHGFCDDDNNGPRHHLHLHHESRGLHERERRSEKLNRL